MKKNLAPSNRHSRLASATLVVLGLLLFMFVTWRDYAEDARAPSENLSLGLGLGLGLDSAGSDPRAAAPAADNALASALASASSVAAATQKTDESVRNSLRVQEQISTIRGELSSAGSEREKEHVRATTILAPGNAAQRATGAVISNTVFSPERNLNEILNTSPVVLFVRSSQRDSQYLRSLLLREYEISPQIAVVDLDQHAYGDALQRHIRDTKMGRREDAPLPYLFVNGVSAIANSAQNKVRDAHVDGELLDQLRHLAAGKVLFQKVGAPSNN
ncbi:pheromone-regulated protein [Maudiozyma humilis]|uniref:Pheromone-regulated protein n=1 Tax=Maudiozyma humilis TaxID=51915 RepID=A0AAV5S933_MAUHU|nr:pheromone-regulated protein [Kazachstania humilis]